MGQKANPISLRLHQTNRYFDSSWFNDYNYTYLINRDLKVKSYINFVLKQIKYSSGRFFIQNLPHKIKIYVFFHNVKSSRKKLAQPFRLREYKKFRALKLKKNFFQEKNFFFKQHKIYTKNKAKLFYYLLQNQIKILQQTYNKLSLVNFDKHNYKKNKVNFGLNNNIYIPLFFRYLLLKNLCMRPQAKLMFKNFLLSNIINFKLLNNKKNLFLTLNHLNIQLHHYSNDFACLNKKQLSVKKLPLRFGDKQSLSPKDAFLDELKNETSVQTSLNRQTKFGEVLKQTMFVSPNEVCRDKQSLSLNLQTSKQLPKVNTLKSHLQKQMYCVLSSINNEPLSKTHNQYRKFASLLFYKNFKQHENKFNSFTLNKLFRGLETNEVCLPKQSLSGKKKSLTLSNPPYKKHLESVFSNNFSSNVCLSFFQAFDKTQNAAFLADEIAYYLEKRVPFFKIKNYILKEMIVNKNKFSHIKGLRIVCSGRVGGKSKKAQRSKTQNMKYGETSLHVFSSKIDFSIKHALTAFGLVGVKVWVCYK